MKKFIIALVAMFMVTFTSASAMSYEQARQQALFLTDKMAYELNLTDDQYEAAYEINLDYLMGVNTVDDLYGVYWRQRNLDLSYILLDWQYRTFCSAAYFYRPLYWDGGFFHFGIYARYPRRDYFFFGRPHFFNVYRGAHSWRMNGGRSWYHGREFGGPRPGGNPRIGMRDGFNRGDFGRGRAFGNMNRQSSTRTTVTRDRSFGNGPRPGNNGGGFGNGTRPGGSNGRFNGGFNARPNNNGAGNPVVGGGSFGGNRSFGNGAGNGGNRTFGGGTINNSRPSNGGFTPRSTTPSSGSFGGNRGGSFGGNRSFGNGSSSGNSRSFGGGFTRSNGGKSGGGSNGGGHFGGRR